MAPCCPCASLRVVVVVALAPLALLASFPCVTARMALPPVGLCACQSRDTQGQTIDNIQEAIAKVQQEVIRMGKEVVENDGRLRDSLKQNDEKFKSLERRSQTHGHWSQ